MLVCVRVYVRVCVYVCAFMCVLVETNGARRVCVSEEAVNMCKLDSSVYALSREIRLEAFWVNLEVET